MTKSPANSQRLQPIRVIDAGVGTEIQRNGVDPHPCYWTALVHMEQPALVEKVYRDYLASGATILTTNSFMAGRHILEAGGNDDFERVNVESVNIIRRLCERDGKSGITIAGSLSPLPPLDRADSLPRGRIVAQNFKEQAQILVNSGADILLAEMLIESETTEALLDACCATGVPVWAGVSATTDPADRLMAFRPDGKLGEEADETFDRLLRSACQYPLHGLGVMHTDWRLIERSLRQIEAHWSGEKMAYAKSGSFSDQDWNFEHVVTPNDYATAAINWCVEFDLRIVGGCCGIGPTHLKSLATKVAQLNERNDADH